MVLAEKIMAALLLGVLLLSGRVFAQQSTVYYSDSLTKIVDIGTSTVADTTEYSTNMLESTGRRPSRVHVFACISDTTVAMASPTNTAVVTVWGYSGSTWWYIAKWDKTADYGSWMKYIENFSFSKLRFITTGNTGYVKIALELIRER